LRELCEEKEVRDEEEEEEEADDKKQSKMDWVRRVCS
jgi:hypothetical protein